MGLAGVHRLGGRLQLPVFVLELFLQPLELQALDLDHFVGGNYHLVEHLYL